MWAADPAIAAMRNEDWSGILVTLPGVDKAAHMWGGVIDPGGGLPFAATSLIMIAKPRQLEVGATAASA